MKLSITKKTRAFAIILRVCGCNRQAIWRRDRHLIYVYPRHLIAWYLHRKVGISLGEVARKVNLKSHATILNGVRRIDNLLKYPQELTPLTKAIIELVEAIDRGEKRDIEAFKREHPVKLSRDPQTTKITRKLLDKMRGFERIERAEVYTIKEKPKPKEEKPYEKPKPRIIPDYEAYIERRSLNRNI